MRHRTSILLTVGFCLLFQISSNIESQARSFRTSMIPNGNVLSCNACHNSPGGPRNAFGLDVEKLVSRGGSETFWSAALAALDSDGDGVSNGVELGDPNGTWASGDANPGDSSTVTNPGDPGSFPDLSPTSPGDAWVAVLSGNQVVSPVNTPARGTAIFKLHEPEKTLIYYLNVFEIQDITAAHIHLGTIGENGGVAHPLETPSGGSSSGSLDVSDDDITNLKAGLFYVQVHTQANPGGEIRGQIEDKPLEFKASLDSGQIVGGGVSSAGTGTMDVTLNEDLSTISYTLSVTNLDGITSAHIHDGARGISGRIAIPLTNESFGTITGQAELDEDKLNKLLSEGLYVNVHTTQNPGGEIRGQIVYDAPMEEPSGISGWVLFE